jgi:hypothetical protein
LFVFLIGLLSYDLLGGRVEDGLQGEHRGRKNESATHSPVTAKMSKQGVEERSARYAEAYMDQHT